MKGDRRLRLVPPGGEGQDAPPTGEDALAQALRAAYGLGAPLSEDVHEAMLDRALAGGGASRREVPDDERPADPAELRAAETLRDALEGKAAAEDPETRALVALARALSAAYQPRPLDEIRHQAVLGRHVGRPRDRRRSVQTASGVLLALAAAAAAVFGLRLQPAEPPAPAAELQPTELSSSASLAVSRSTQELFDAAEPFVRSGGTSARVDRIAKARASDLRGNRFARWGVR